MDEDSAAFNDVPNTAEEDAYNGACWKVVRNKPRAHNAAALEAASPLPVDSKNPKAEPRLSAAQRLPPLSFRDEKSTSPSIHAKRPSYPASQVSPSSYKEALLGKAATTTTITEHQQQEASEANKTKAASPEAEPARVDVTLRKVTKFAHGLPHYTATTCLKALGFYNTLSELLEAQRNSQRKRRLVTPTGDTFSRDCDVQSCIITSKTPLLVSHLGTSYSEGASVLPEHESSA
ncbi:hypothetical protein HPB51_010446 [Rhipicephalus microplus]|uniref:Uncharacterized protein n=1 Tax=Rhipicephalus microplus TaxID=6941 RepID=A0A9J6ESR5_RHIMP|nr:hypothetical protein HPB51_010446 [Rhipicephalus microplus]